MPFWADLLCLPIRQLALIWQRPQANKLTPRQAKRASRTILALSMTIVRMTAPARMASRSSLPIAPARRAHPTGNCGSSTSACGRRRMTGARSPRTMFFVEDADGRRIGPMPGLSDAMPFGLRWSPRAGRVFVIHHVGSFMGTPEVYDVTADGVVRRDAFKLTAVDAAIAAFPCLSRYRGLGLAAGGIAGWSEDARYLAWVFETRLDVCLPPEHTGAVPPELTVEPMLMISDLDTGAIVPGSFRVLDDYQAEVFRLPEDGPYQRITQGSR
ncbi:MAG: hypothetical protein C0471_06105 [Erythrobacter sp.]|nr:hypothetical protein [Erythrobacter sp.]